MGVRLIHESRAETHQPDDLPKLLAASARPAPSRGTPDRGLRAVRTMAALNHEVYAWLARLDPIGTGISAAGPALLLDTVDRFERVRTIAEAQKEYLHGIIEFYQTRTNITMIVAAERPAMIVSDRTRYGTLWVLLAPVAGMPTWLPIWARRRGWW